MLPFMLKGFIDQLDIVDLATHLTHVAICLDTHVSKCLLGRNHRTRCSDGGGGERALVEV